MRIHGHFKVKATWTLFFILHDHFHPHFFKTFFMIFKLGHLASDCVRLVATFLMNFLGDPCLSRASYIHARSKLGFDLLTIFLDH